MEVESVLRSVILARERESLCLCQCLRDLFVSSVLSLKVLSPESYSLKVSQYGLRGLCGFILTEGESKNESLEKSHLQTEVKRSEVLQQRSILSCSLPLVSGITNWQTMPKRLFPSLVGRQSEVNVCFETLLSGQCTREESLWGLKVLRSERDFLSQRESLRGRPLPIILISERS